MRRILPVLMVVLPILVLRAAPAEAAYQTCNGTLAADEITRCPDGSIPSYVPGTPPAPAGVAAKPAETDDAGKPNLFGIWHTTLPGMSYQTAGDVPGSYALDTRPGLGGGDLTIAANGSFTWNTNSGMSGRWLKGEPDMPIVLLDDVSHKRWKVGIVRGQMTITDGRAIEYGRR